MNEELGNRIMMNLLGAAAVVQVLLIIYCVIFAKWNDLKWLILAFMAWIGSTFMVVLSSIGACAAGCPSEPFNTIIGVFLCAPSVGIFLWLPAYYLTRNDTSR